MASIKKINDHSFKASRLLIILVIALGLYILLPQLNVFKDSLQVAKTADARLMCLAVLAMVLTFFAAATTYKLLALRSLEYLSVVKIQMSAMFVNRLLPAGIGSIGTNFVYLTKSGKHSKTEAATVVATNNFLGFVSHLLFMTFLVVFFHDQIPKIKLPEFLHNPTAIILITIVTFFALGVIFLRNNKISKKIKQTLKLFLSYKTRPKSIVLAIGSSMTVTALNVAILWFSAMALEVQISFFTALIIFTFGVMVFGQFTPTPGGLGGVEAGVTATLMTLGASSSTALAVALTYRLVSYWFSMGIGALAFAWCRHSRLI